MKQNHPSQGSCHTRTNHTPFTFKTVTAPIVEVYGACDRKIERAAAGDIALTAADGTVSYTSAETFNRHFIIIQTNQ